MGHYAKIDENNIVVEVVVSSKETIDTGIFGPPEKWIKTSYNTMGGKHYAPSSLIEDDKPPLRKNYAGVGHIYDSVRDAFYTPQPYPSWTLNEDTCMWEPPVKHPNDRELSMDDTDGSIFYKWRWSEEELKWIVNE